MRIVRHFLGRVEDFKIVRVIFIEIGNEIRERADPHALGKFFVIVNDDRATKPLVDELQERGLALSLEPEYRHQRVLDLVLVILILVHFSF